MVMSVPIDLTTWCNNRGISRADELDRGAFNAWGNSFPAEELPAAGSRFTVGAIPFVFAGGGDVDNVRCARQLVIVEPARYDWLYLLAAAERRTEDSVYLHYADGSVDPEWLRVSAFWPEQPPRFGEQAALRCTSMHYPRHVQRGFGPTIWRERVPVTREVALAAIRLPDNPSLHLFALTAVRATMDRVEEDR